VPRKMFLIDGSNHAFRVQYALPPMNASDGFPTRALYGFTTLFAKILRVHRPDYCAVAFDRGLTFRHEMYPDYKGHRPDMPEDLRQQWPHFDALVEGFGYPSLFVEGFEADDVMGTVARRFASPDLEVFLVTGDRDFAQLVDDNIHILDLMKNKEIGPAEVQAEFGVGPDRIVDLKGLAGDSSDNIPGIPGIGVKKASSYLNRFGTLEDVLDHADDVGGKTGLKIKENAEIARLSKVLATIRLDVPLDLTLEALAPKGLQHDALRELFDRWEFGKVAHRLLGEQQVVDTSIYRAAATVEELDALVAALRAAGRFAVEVELHGKDPRHADLLGISFCWGRKDAVYVPLRERRPDRVDPEEVLSRLKPLLEDPDLGKTGHRLKAVMHVLGRRGIVLRGIDGDTQLLDYCLAAHERSHALDNMAQRFLGFTMSPYQQQVPVNEGLFFDQIDLEDQARYGAETPHVSWILEARLLGRLDPGPRWVYERIEVPLVPVLAGMEEVGIRVDLDELKRARDAVALQVEETERRCYEAAGKEFNINSRHETRDVLFDDLGLPPSKKVKDGWSTDSSVLEKLVGLHTLPALILEYRRLQKLLSTYLDALPAYVEKDGRIHTRFNQAVAATGRLSSNDPNLQNIPIRTEDGRRTRDAFVPEEGWMFLSADYSQVELRVLAHFCEEPALVRSFASGEDIHRRTASEVFGIPADEVTFAQRNAAKAINFGLIYGMSAFRLGNELSIPHAEAQRYMDEYFGRMPQVKAWLDATRDQAHQDGHVQTLFGRRRVIPNIHSRQFNLRKAAEREAVNTVVQGTAADIIKLAMLRVDEMLRHEGYRARLLLQVHDELLLEVPPDEVDAVRAAVVDAMQRAAELKVPLVANSAVGSNWNEAHG